MDNRDELLGALQAHGNAFLHSFASPNIFGKRKSDAATHQKSKKPKIQPDDTSEYFEEWYGISDSNSPSVEGTQPADGRKGAEVVVFSGVDGPNPPNLVSKAQRKALMSSKISKLREDIPGAMEPNPQSEADNENERSNAQNDALLHRLVHTKLLSGSLNPELDSTPAQRRKALAGRVLEAAGGAKLGKGEKSVREAERNKAAKHVRDGIMKKQRDREQQRLVEAKNLGNYHPSLKKLFEPSSSTINQKRDRASVKLNLSITEVKEARLKEIVVLEVDVEEDHNSPFIFGRRWSSHII
ncbi:hypothetical protein BD779DRAFT_1667433 [Infundibulicybe gibba]|nr:hypothetical protein BD779DRAFT_1667433 [Infundibulicybe gibba]